MISGNNISIILIIFTYICITLHSLQNIFPNSVARKMAMKEAGLQKWTWAKERRELHQNLGLLIQNLLPRHNKPSPWSTRTTSLNSHPGEKGMPTEHSTPSLGNTWSLWGCKVTDKTATHKKATKSQDTRQI